MSNDEGVTLDEAADHLKLRFQWVLQHRVSAGFLDACFVGDMKEPGVTLASVEHELRWWDEANVTRKVLRRTREIINYL